MLFVYSAYFKPWSTLEAVELIDRVYEMYAVGKVEIYLVQPAEMAQVLERSRESMDAEGEGEANYNVSNRHAKIEPLDDDENNNDEDTDVQDSVKAILAHDDKDLEDVAGDTKVRWQNQSNMRWTKRTDLGDHGGSMRQPLASYDVGRYITRFMLFGQ